MSLSPVIPSTRANEIRYAIRDIVVLANKVAKTGQKMLYLNIGDPNVYDFTVPDFVVDAVGRAMKENRCGYSPSSGIAEGVEAIRNEAHRKGIKNILDIFITTGASEAIEICMTALLNPGENILTPAPGYPLYTAVVSKLGTEENPYLLDEENGWQPDVADMERKINDKTRAIVLINPNNPTGSIAKEETLRAVIALAKKYNLVIFADEIYDKLVLDGGQTLSIASLDQEVGMITFGGLSKVYLGPGLRIGWGIVSGQTELMGNYVEAINKILRARLCANHPIQYAIKPCLEGAHPHLPEVLNKLRARRDLTVSMLNEIKGISLVAPKGAFYAFAKLNEVKDDNKWTSELMWKTGVVVVPGSGFGQKPGTSHFRVVFLPDENTLKSAYEKIAWFQKEWHE